MNHTRTIDLYEEGHLAAVPTLQPRTNLAATAGGTVALGGRLRKTWIGVMPLLCCLLFPAAVRCVMAGEALGPGDHTRVVTSGRHTRSYLVHIPPDYTHEQATPVVLAFHGAGINASAMVLLSGLNKKADEGGFIAVYPNGTGLANLVLTWNAGGLPEGISERKPDDVAFVAALLDDLATAVHVDARRVYATGMSNGGMMCYRLAAGLAERIAAIAPVCGTLAIDPWKPCRPMPVMHFHGTADRLVPFDGPNELVPKFLVFKSVEETMRICAAANGCAGKPKKTRLPDTVDDGTSVVRSAYAPCREGAEVVLFTVEGGGHTWPGQPPPNQFLGKSTKDIAANDLMWEFFCRHSLE